MAPGKAHGAVIATIARLRYAGVKGNAVFGTLRKEGAVILFEGIFDPKTRKLRFDETKVVRLGAEMNEWSLGKNRGTLSPDGRTLAGDGEDEWGSYDWEGSKY